MHYFALGIALIVGAQDRSVVGMLIADFVAGLVNESQATGTRIRRRHRHISRCAQFRIEPQQKAFDLGAGDAFVIDPGKSAADERIHRAHDDYEPCEQCRGDYDFDQREAFVSAFVWLMLRCDLIHTLIALEAGKAIRLRVDVSLYFKLLLFTFE